MSRLRLKRRRHVRSSRTTGWQAALVGGAEPGTHTMASALVVVGRRLETGKEAALLARQKSSPPHPNRTASVGRRATNDIPAEAFLFFCRTFMPTLAFKKITIAEA